MTVTGEADGKHGGHGERGGVLRVRLTGEQAGGGSPVRQPDWFASLASLRSACRAARPRCSARRSSAHVASECDAIRFGMSRAQAHGPRVTGHTIN